MFSAYKALLQEIKDKPKRKKSTAKYFLTKSTVKHSKLKNNKTY